MFSENLRSEMPCTRSRALRQLIIPEYVFRRVTHLLSPIVAAPLTDFTAVGSGDFVYLTGGANSSGIALNQVLRYDSLLHTYTPVAPLLAPRYRHGADVLNGEKWGNGLFLESTLCFAGCFDIVAKLLVCKELLWCYRKPSFVFCKKGACFAQQSGCSCAWVSR